MIIIIIVIVGGFSKIILYLSLCPYLAFSHHINHITSIDSNTSFSDKEEPWLEEIFQETILRTQSLANDFEATVL